MKCFQCSKDCSRANIKCEFCNHSFHIACASKDIPNMTAAMIEMIKNSQGALLYQCSQCISKPLQDKCISKPQQAKSSSKPVQDSSSNADVNSKLETLETKLENISKLLVDSVLPQLSSIKTDITDCVSRIEKFEVVTKAKIEKLTVETNFLRKQLNRGDILISGLPSKLTNDELYDAVEKIGDVLDVKIEPYDINLCTWIRNKKVVLVKFNSARKRDNLMAKYFKEKNLQVNHIIDTDIEARVYMNEHLTPIAANLQFLCRRLLKEKKISKYNIKNTSVPEVKLVLNDGTEKSVRFDMIKEFIATGLTGNAAQTAV